MLYVSHINVDGTISVKDSVTKEIRHFEKVQIESPYTMIPFILGVIRVSGQVEIHEVTWENGSDCLIPLIEDLKNPTIREYANLVRHLIPPYIFEIPASSTGKYHPASDAGEGGLKRHLISVTKTLDYLTQPEFSHTMFTDDEIDLMKVACMFHDGLKNGWEQEKYTRFDHPLLMAKAITGTQTILNADMVNFIACCIATHMGEWNTSKYAPNVTLPKPDNKYQYFVHLADYLASRSDINYVFGNTVYYQEGQNVEKIGTKDKSSTPVAVLPTSKPQKARLTDADLQSVQIAIQKAQTMQIPQAMITKLGIERGQAEIIDIWGNLVQFKQCSEKQQKYLVLANQFAWG